MPYGADQTGSPPVFPHRGRSVCPRASDVGSFTVHGTTDLLFLSFENTTILQCAHSSKEVNDSHQDNFLNLLFFPVGHYHKSQLNLRRK